MRITHVRVHKLLTGPGYNNQSCDAEAIVESGETPEDVHDRLNLWVDAQLRNEREFRVLREDVDALRECVRTLEKQRDNLRAAIENNRKIIREHDKLAKLAAEQGIPELLDESLPF